jgi:hypothetical protein
VTLCHEDYVELANTATTGTDGQAHHVHLRPIARASNAVAWTRNSQDLWISVLMPLVDRSPTRQRRSWSELLGLQIILGRDSNDSTSARTDDEPELFAPGSVEACWSRFAEAQGRYRQDILGRIIGLDNEVGITWTRTRVRQACPGVSIDPTVVLWLIRATGAVRPTRLGEWLR